MRRPLRGPVPADGIDERKSASSVPSIPVSISVGASALTVMPGAAYSPAIDLMSAIAPAFDAAYAGKRRRRGAGAVDAGARADEDDTAEAACAIPGTTRLDSRKAR